MSALPRGLRRSVLIALSSAALLQACDDGDGPSVRIRTLGTEFGTSQIFMLRLTSLSDRIIFYNLCPSVYERRVQQVWVSIPESRPTVCTQELNLLPAGETVDVTLQIPAVITPGTYRIVFETVFFREDRPMPPAPIEPLPEHERTTNAFEVALPTL